MWRTLALASALMIVGSLAYSDVPEGAVMVGQLYVKDNETMGTPYKAYWVPEPFLHKFLESDELDPMKFAKLAYYAFPIITSNGQARSVSIQEVRGRYMWIGSLKENTTDTRLSELGKNGEAYIMRGDWFGVYIFAHSKKGELMIAPVEEYCADYLGLKPDDNGLYPLVKFDDVKTKLKAAIQKSVNENPIPPGSPDAQEHRH